MSVNEIDEPGEDEEEDEEDVPLAAEEEASFEEFLSKSKDTTDSEEEDEETILALTREERLESLSIRAAPKQPNEFVCTSCRLVKHESQLADAKRELCRDCV